MSVKCKSCGHEHTDWVPKDRLDGQRQSLTAQIEAAEAKATLAEEKLRAAEDAAKSAPDVAGLQRRLERAEKRAAEVEERYEREAGEWKTSSALLAAGVTDPDDQDLVRYRYGKLPEAGRPDLAGYLSGSAKEDKYLRHLFGGGETEAAEPKPSPKAALNGNRGVVQSQPSGGSALAALAAMPYDESRKKVHAEVMASLRGGKG